MGNKTTNKDTGESRPSFFARVGAAFKNDTVRFVIGLLLVVFSVYLLLAFTSFFFTGAADQSILDSGDAAELASADNGVKNYLGSRGAQLASYLINDCFGIASYFILVFLIAVGVKLMR
ncbi:MAG: DNA translocase FtsK 4TM domain-containing protein, partial [Prevotellaceae bacterium]|nr:DNA translocase FtsK 4TM domain-containing protein [Prevotellaceae bacterium]